MPITWENLVKLEYNFKLARWKSKTHYYVFKPACANCGLPFLTTTFNKGLLCSRNCLCGSFNGSYKDGRSSDCEYKSQKNKQWREENPDYFPQWAAENRDKINAASARRRARKINQTPADASKEKIDWFFKVAANLTEATGEPWHVDHIQPLAEDGPHHENNLQVLPGSENRKKRAKVGVNPTGITIEVYNVLMGAFDFLYSIACPKK